jgi:coenzyme F420 hydrogenase subunit beta
MAKLFEHLEEEVVNPGFCVGCGACVAACPVKCLEMRGEIPALTRVCINCRICYGVCPEIMNPEILKKEIFGDAPSDELLGTYTRALTVRATDAAVKTRCQDGGAVTALLSSLLEADYIDGAILVGTQGEPWRPVARVATTTEELTECAGSKYSPAPMFIGLRDAVFFHYCERVAIVGTPCQILASWRMKFSDPTNRHLADAIKLRVGLFCGGVFEYDKLKEVVEKRFNAPLADVTKFDMRSNKFIIHRGEKLKQDIPLSSVKEQIHLPCRLCPDFTAELADISVGSAGSPEGFSTVLIRTSVGDEAFDTARRFRKFEAANLKKVKLSIENLRKEAGAKKAMAAEELEALRKLKKALPVWLQEHPPEIPKETVESIKEIHASRGNVQS